MKRLLSLSLFLMTAMLSFAHDFESGGIYYNITSSTAPYTVAVTYQGTSWSEYGNEYTGSVIIPEKVTYNGKTYSVTSIGDYAFTYCSGLTSVTIPNSVTSISNYAFYGCSGLTSITIPNSVTTIGSNAFRECSGLTSVTIPSSVTSIGYQAFLGCSGLTSVTIGSSVTSIGSNAFYNCSGLINVNINSNSIISKEYSSTFNLSNIFGSQVKSYIIGDDVTAIGNYAFCECSGLKSVTIPNSVTSIGSDAFIDCESLTKVIVPDIAAWCNISFGNYAANPLYYAGRIFSDENTEITDLVIPNSVTTIGSDAFYGCSGLTSIVVENGNTKYDSRDNCNAIIETASNTLILGCKTTVIPNSVTSIGSSAFFNCYSLTSITIPNSVTAIGSDAFTFCSGLTSVTIGNSVTSIGSYAFYECSGLKSVTIPNNVTSIGDMAFGWCTGLKEITSYIQEPFQIVDYCWEGVDKSIPLYVPVGTKEAYQSTGGWKDFTNIIEKPADPTGINSVDNSQSATGNEAGDWYTIDGRKLSGKPVQKGIYIVNGRKVAVK